MKSTLYFILCLLMLPFLGKAQSTLISADFTGTTNWSDPQSGTAPARYVPVVAPGAATSLSVSSFNRFNGAGNLHGSLVIGNILFSNGASGRGLWTTSESGASYYQVTITPATGKRLTITNISFGYFRNTTGPGNSKVRYSFDGFTNDYGSGTLTGYSTNTAVPTSGSFDFSTNNSGTTPLVIRIYAWGTLTGGFGIDNFSVSGTVEDNVSGQLPELGANTFEERTVSGFIAQGNVSSSGGDINVQRGFVTTSGSGTLALGEPSVTRTDLGTGGGSFQNTFTGLSTNTAYRIKSFAINVTGTSYSEEQTVFTLQTEPTNYSTINSVANGANDLDISFSTASNASGYLVLYKLNSLPTALPVDGTVYSVGNNLSDGSVVGAVGSATSVNIASLASNSIYRFYVIPYQIGIDNSTINYKTDGSIPNGTLDTYLPSPVTITNITPPNTTIYPELKNPIVGVVSINSTNRTLTLNEVNFTRSGTYSEVSFTGGYSLFLNTTNNNFNNATLLGSVNGSGTSLSFTGLNGSFPANQTYYLIVTRSTASYSSSQTHSLVVTSASFAESNTISISGTENTVTLNAMQAMMDFNFTNPDRNNAKNIISNITVSTISATNVASTFYSGGFTTGTNEAYWGLGSAPTPWPTVSSINLGQYVQFSITPNSGSSIDIAAIAMGVTTGSGTFSGYRIAWDGTTQNNFTTNFIDFTANGNARFRHEVFPVNISGLNRGIIFRIYAWGASSTTAILGLDEIKAYGEVNCSVIAPATISGIPTVGTVTASSVQVTPVAGIGTGRLIVARLNNVAPIAPTNAIDYNTSTNFTTPNATLGTTGSGNVVVYDGNSGNVTISGLTANTEYAFDVYEYNGNAECRRYFTSPRTITAFTHFDYGTTAYRTRQSGAINSIGTYEFLVRPATWANATTQPTVNNTITIRNGHTLSANASDVAYNWGNLVCEEGAVIQLGNRMTIAEGSTWQIFGSLEKTSTRSFNTNNNLIIKSSGTFINTSSSANPDPTMAGNIQLEKEGRVLARGLSYYSSPVTGAVASVLAFGQLQNVRQYAEETSTWQPLTANEPLLLGKGYTGLASIAPQFVGVANNGSIVTPVTLTGSSGWNLIGNPYPSSLNVTTFLNANAVDATSVIRGSIYLLDAPVEMNTASQNDYAIIPKVGLPVRSRVGTGRPLTTTISPAQGFFVRAINADNILFDNSMRIGGQSVNFFRIATDTTPALRMNFGRQNDSIRAQTSLVLTPDALWSDNPQYDALRFGATNALSASIMINGRNYSVKAFPNDRDEYIIPLRFNAVSGGLHSFGFDSLRNMIADFSFSLIDTITQEVLPINGTSPITINLSEGVHTEYRLLINRLVTSTNKDLVTRRLKGNYNNGSIHIYGLEEGMYQTSLLSLNGKVVQKNTVRQLTTDGIELPVSLSAGIYLLTVESAEKPSQLLKIVINY